MPGKGRPFKKGESGNNKGRPKKGDSWADVLREAFGEPIEFKGTRKVWKRLIAEVLRKKCLKGDIKAIELVIRVDNQIPQPDDLAESYEERIKRLRQSKELTGRQKKGKTRSLNIAGRIKDLETETEKKIGRKKAEEE